LAEAAGHRGLSTWLAGLQERVFRYAYRKLGNQEDALDAMQDTFVAAFQGADGLPEDEARRASWLFGVAANKVADSLRARYRHRERTSALPAEVASPDDPEATATARHQAAQVRRALEAIPEPYRETLQLVTIDGLAYAEAAAALGCPIGTVRSRVAKGRDLLRRALRTPPQEGRPS
jgi:RNA polymerase sigma-70 factor (ECF subfamily)